MSGKEFYVRYYVGHKGKFGELLFFYESRSLLCCSGHLRMSKSLWRFADTHAICRARISGI